MLQEVRLSLSKLSDLDKAMAMSKYFKSNQNNNVFIGVSIPQMRDIAKKAYDKIDLEDLKQLLHSEIHEEKMLGLIMLVLQFQNGKNEEIKKNIFNFYIQDENLKCINSWDLVDVSSYKILGQYLTIKAEEIKVGDIKTEEIAILYNFVKSQNFWLRRIAIVATFAFIKKNVFEYTVKIAKFLLGDKEDLVQKAVGWMLREMGKRDKETLVTFLKEHHKNMQSTSLRYAIEKFSESEKQEYKRNRAQKKEVQKTEHKKVRTQRK